MKRLFLTFLFSGISFVLLACSCLSITSFCDRATKDSEVISVRITESYFEGSEHYIDGAFLENIQGGLTFENLTLFTGGGSSCDPFPDMFQIGDTLVFIAGTELPSGSSGLPTFGLDFACGANFIIVRNGKVELGNYDLYWEEKYADFTTDFSACASQQIPLDAIVSLLPNPASSEVNLMRRFAPVEYDIFTSSGQLISAKKVIEFTDTMVDVSSYPAGMYFVRFRLNGECRVERLVVH